MTKKFLTSLLLLTYHIVLLTAMTATLGHTEANVTNANITESDIAQTDIAETASSITEIDIAKTATGITGTENAETTIGIAEMGPLRKLLRNFGFNAGLLSQSKGAAGHLAPYLTDSSALGWGFSARWKEQYEFGMHGAGFVGFGGLFGAGYATTFGAIHKQTEEYNGSVRYSRTNINAALPKWVPGSDDGKNHEVIAKIGLRQNKMNFYLLGGAMFSDKFWQDKYITLAGIGATPRILINERIEAITVHSITINALAAIDQEKSIYGKLGASVLININMLPGMLKIGLHGIKGKEKMQWLRGIEWFVAY